MIKSLLGESVIFEKEERWILSPAYDLTFSYSIGGEHATTVHGNGKNPGMTDILEVAKSIGMNLNSAKIIAENVRECVNEKLGLYLIDIYYHSIFSENR